jgi:hypothetical protein
MRRIVLFVVAVSKYAMYAVAGLLSLYVLYIVGVVAYIALGEANIIPGFKLSDHMSKDQGCMVYPPPKGCPGNVAGKSN